MMYCSRSKLLRAIFGFRSLQILLAVINYANIIRLKEKDFLIFKIADVLGSWLAPGQIIQAPV